VRLVRIGRFILNLFRHPTEPPRSIVVRGEDAEKLLRRLDRIGIDPWKPEAPSEHPSHPDVSRRTIESDEHPMGPSS
jgi:hypothetical protein